MLFERRIDGESVMSATHLPPPSKEALAYLEAMEIMESRRKAEADAATQTFIARDQKTRRRAGNAMIVSAIGCFALVVWGFANAPEHSVAWLYGGIFLWIFCCFVIILVRVGIYLARQAQEASKTPEGRNAVMIAGVVGLSNLSRR